MTPLIKNPAEYSPINWSSILSFLQMLLDIVEIFNLTNITFVYFLYLCDGYVLRVIVVIAFIFIYLETEHRLLLIMVTEEYQLSM